MSATSRENKMLNIFNLNTYDDIEEKPDIKTLKPSAWKVLDHKFGESLLENSLGL